LSRIYRRGELLGVGSHATVFEGWDVLLDRAVAIKELLPAFAADDAFVRAFLGRSLQMLDVAHDHLLVTYPADHGHHPPAVVRELADQTLEPLLIASPLPVAEVEEILRQVLSGLEVLHRRGLVHGGIKPQNLFRCGERFKIGDFGVSPLASGAAAVPARERRYTAPEILRGEEGGAASDIYSLGLVAYELLIGPLRYEQLAEELARQAGFAPEADQQRAASDQVWPAFHASPAELPTLHRLVAGFPMALSLTLQQMTRKAPADRFGDASQLLASLGVASPGASREGAPAASGAGKIGTGESRAPATATSDRSGKGTAPGVPAPLQLIAGALAAALLTGLGWLLARHGEVDPSVHPASAGHGFTSPAEPATDHGLPGGAATCSPAGIESAQSPASLAAELRRLATADRTLALDLDLPAGAAGVTPAPLAVGTPVRFRVTSDRPGHLLFFELAADGTVTCLYPNSRRPDLALAGAGDSVEVPAAEDERAGFTLALSEPLGLDLVVALRSDQRLSPPEIGPAPPPWYREYPFGATGPGPASPAKDFAAWVARLRCEPQAAVSVAVREMEVVGKR